MSREAMELMHQSTAGLISYDDFTSRVAQLTGNSPERIKSLLRNEQSKNTQLLEYISELKQRGYKIGLLSNIANNWVRESFLTADEQELFDEMIFSYEVGMTKPDPRIYMLACERLRVSAHEVVMIDDIASYVEAAKAEGMAGVVYSDFAQMKGELEAIL